MRFCGSRNDEQNMRKGRKCMSARIDANILSALEFKQ